MMDAAHPLQVHITCADAAEARAIARALVEDRLAACVVQVPGALSTYRWEGAVEESAEVLLLAKTVAGRFDALAARVRALHRYRCPCIIALPIVAGDPAYLAWLAEEVGA